jgi:hypothetical protein
MTTLQFTKINMLHSFVTQVFIDSIILGNEFKKMKTRNKLGSMNFFKKKYYRMQEREKKG